MIDPVIAARRQIAIYHLRQNPKRFKQIRGSLRNAWDERCAVGVIADAFNLPVEIDDENPGIYNKLTKLLGLKELSFIWFLNDFKGFSFPEIASEMEKRWSEDNDTGSE